jgi:ferredoxin
MPVEEPGYFIRVAGDCREISFNSLKAKAEADPMFSLGVKDILRYPNMTAFCLWRFRGEIYDYDYEMVTRDHKLQRTFFDFGGFRKTFYGLRIGPNCIGCGICMANCTFKAISFTDAGTYHIDIERCDACGTCRHNCPADAIEVYQ